MKLLFINKRAHEIIIIRRRAGRDVRELHNFIRGELNKLSKEPSKLEEKIQYLQVYLPYK